MSGRDRGDEERTPKIYVSNLNTSTSEDDLRKYFSEFGNIVNVILKHKDPILFAFVEFESMREAEKAIEAMNHKSINGFDIRVQFAKGDRRRFGDAGNSRGGDDRPRRDFSERPRGCFNCGEDGHMARDCEKPRKPREFVDRGGYRGGREDRGDRRDRDRDDRRGKEDRDRRQKRKHSSSGSRSRSRSNDKKRKQKKRKHSSSSSRS